MNFITNKDYCVFFTCSEFKNEVSFCLSVLAPHCDTVLKITSLTSVTSWASVDSLAHHAYFLSLLAPWFISLYFYHSPVGSCSALCETTPVFFHFVWHYFLHLLNQNGYFLIPCCSCKLNMTFPFFIFRVGQFSLTSLHLLLSRPQEKNINIQTNNPSCRFSENLHC